MGILNAIRASYGVLHILSGLSGLINLFCKRFDREKNRAARAAVETTLPRGFLSGQRLAPLADLPYGAWNMGENGCEVIAAYNALLALDRPEPLHKVAEELENRGLLFNGFGGTNPAALPRFFQRRNVNLRLLRRRDSDRYDAALQNARCAILSYWTGPKLRREDKTWNTLHTVSVQPAAGHILLHNVHGYAARPETASSLAEFLARESGVPVCLLLLSEVDKPCCTGL